MSNSSIHQSQKYGDLRRCPNCGCVLDSLDVVCPDCGYEIHGISSVSSFYELAQKIDAVEEQMAKIYATKTANRQIGLVDKIFGANKGPSEDEIDAKKAEIINNFPIPNTKEDVVEFLINAIPLSVPINPDDYVSTAWRTKCEQVLSKSRLLFKKDPKLLAEIKNIAKPLQDAKDRKQAKIERIKRNNEKKAIATKNNKIICTTCCIILIFIEIITLGRWTYLLGPCTLVVFLIIGAIVHNLIEDHYDNLNSKERWSDLEQRYYDEYEN